MLKFTYRGLGADVPNALHSMAHDDDLMLCNTNFPAESVAREIALGKLMHMESRPSGEAARAVLSLMPLNTCAALRWLLRIQEGRDQPGDEVPG